MSKPKNHYSWGPGGFRRRLGASWGRPGALGRTAENKPPHTHRHQSCQSVYTRISASKRGMCKCGNSQGVYTRTSAPGMCTCKLSMCVHMYPGQNEECATWVNRQSVYTRTWAAQPRYVYNCKSPCCRQQKNKTPSRDTNFEAQGTANRVAVSEPPCV